MTELRPIYSSQKSFYGKAIINYDFQQNEITLYSYGTKVCIIRNGKPEILGFHSVTTLKHIKEFLKQHNFKADHKKQMENDYYKGDF